VNALLLGLYDAQGRLHYIGHAGSGRLTGRDWAEITAAAELLRTPDCPFVARPPRSAGAVWLRPFLTAKVRYLEWTEGRTLRQPVIEAVGAGPPEDCSFERLDDAPV
jgi:bifunctional non-homologous end joining protein LigD